MFLLTVMEWVAFVSLDSVFGTRGVIWWLPGGYSLGMWWESGLGVMGVLGMVVFPMDFDSGVVGCWDTWTGPRGLT